MNILVTGGAGFIGGNYLLLMVEKHPDDMYICLDALTYAGNLVTLNTIANKPNFIFVKGNICDKKKVFDLFEKYHFDYVVNFAAETHVDRAALFPEIFVATNISGTQTLLEACRKYGIKRYHQVSTDEVYGDLPLDAKDDLFTENSYIKPSSPYSASKASADLLCLAYHRTFGTPITISRCSNNYGSYQHPEKLIPLIISRALTNQSLPVYGNGLNIRDWLYVDDHCEAIDLILRSGKDGEIYNVGGNNEKTNLEVIKTILRALKKPDSLITFVKDRPGHDLRYAIDASKLRKLGWVPKVKFDEGIAQTILWYKSNQEWIDIVEDNQYSKWISVQYRDIKKI